jgi:hypothetical protein
MEDMILSKVGQAQKHKGCMFSLICGTQIQKINIYTKPNRISQTQVAHAYNPSYSGSRDQEDHGSKPA